MEVGYKLKLSVKFSDDFEESRAAQRPGFLRKCFFGLKFSDDFEESRAALSPVCFGKWFVSLEVVTTKTKERGGRC